jgi:hypothetical protein
MAEAVASLDEVLAFRGGPCYEVTVVATRCKR